MSGQRPRAVLHVGAPKTGTTYLQAVLWHNRAALHESGWLYPLQRPNEHFAATLDLREMAWAGRVDGPWVGTWSRVAERVEAWEGSVLLSNELLGGVTTDQARTVVKTLAGRSGREVHVVFTARDLARQLPSDWQEHVKHRHDVTLCQFVDDLVRLGRDAPAPFGEMFWGLHDAELVLGRWAEVLPPDQLHLVTVPRGQTGPHALWERFAVAAGLEGVDLDVDVEPANVSMGVAEAELVRRLNTHIKNRFPHRFYDGLVRQILVDRVLVAEERVVPRSERPTLPAGHDDWVTERSRRLVEAVTDAGYDVVGDLDDLVPAAGQGGRQPDDIGTDELLPVALDAIAGLLRHLVNFTDGPNTPELRQQVNQLTAQLQRSREEVDYWRDGGLAHRLVRFSDQHAWVMPARKSYVGLRDRLRGLGADKGEPTGADKNAGADGD